MKSPHSYLASRISLIILSAGLLILCYPNFNLEFLAWIALVPLFFSLENQKPFKAFLISYLTGVLFFIGTIYWLIHVTLPGAIVVILYLALYVGLFGLLYSRAAHRASRVTQLFIIPAAWAVMEWLRANVFGGFGWALLGHSQSYSLPVIQIADLVGAYGVGYLVIMVNMAIYLTIKDFREKDAAFTCAMIALLVLALSLGYGIYRLKNIFTGETLKVAVVQGNIPQSKKWDYHYRDEILSKYERLTKEAAKEKVDLVIWPESAVPGFLGQERDLTDRVKELVKSINTPLLVGSPRADQSLEDTYYNSAILLAEDGRVIDIYDKIHLVPFGEYIPARPMLSFVQKFAPIPIGDFTAGKAYTVFRFFIERTNKDKNITWKLVKKVKFSCLICFEDVFPDLTREFVKQGANFLVNITNDAWFKMSAAPYQHAQSSVFRAVENRANVIRAANTGYSCYIDQKGKIVASVEGGGKDLFIDGYKIHEITLTRTRTFYTVHGDVFAYICILFTIISLIYFNKVKL